MARISLRISETLRKQLEKASSNVHKSMSDYIRDLLVDNVDSEIKQDWQISLWSMLGVTINRSSYAVKKSATVEEFFSYISLFVPKGIEIRPGMPKEYVDLDFTINEKSYNITQKTRFPLIKAIAEIVTKLEEKIMEEYNEEI